ncbi:hypothetical protein [Alloactinosynnema sp. L-07]|nr:hypothetical protein [Alloactinosynnema sp. L-07]
MAQSLRGAHLGAVLSNEQRIAGSVRSRLGGAHQHVGLRHAFCIRPGHQRKRPRFRDGSVETP